MHHYPHHIGDFNAATRHLTRVERSLYRDAIELYYDKENSLTGDFDVLCRRLMARSDEEKEGLRFVLSEFFEFINGRYVHHRCEEEILAYHNNQTNKSKAGKASAEARRKRAEDRRNKEKQQELTDVEQPLNAVEAEGQQNPTNQEPRTKNQEPNKNIVEQARHCIGYLNETCGTNYKHVDANTSLIAARLKEGHTVDDIKSVIDSKRTEWMETDQQMYLRPKTLFSAQNFNNYIGQIGLAKRKKQNWASLSPFELEEKCEQLGIHTKGLSPQAVIAELERAHQ